ncbi:MAG: hypothetical protein KKE30_20430 [Gammaproteobacteria bacterium]|nr:hypothetical protein [Gammaproteobacteria bacterium]MBU1556541.1 hypothetical protein [Gammaproteobacteria bacterium]MBU2072219.1 hypothetical protein [Gammaproteobacteria bacterium]MBU2182081.1 hypothetical protein [Gammaproteobacteria bacterium]MBU2203924.1 hypothetical protein [Gammaproteobacteria bacterium]
MTLTPLILDSGEGKMIQDIDIIKALEKKLGIDIEIRTTKYIDITDDENKIASSRRSRGGIFQFETKIFSTFVDLDKAVGSESRAISDDKGRIIRLYLNFKNLNAQAGAAKKRTQRSRKAPTCDLLPAEIFSLQHLVFLSLYVWDNLSTLPDEFDRLQNLKCVYLGGLPISNLPQSLVYLPSLQELLCVNLPALRTPPKEILRQGLDSIRNYFDARQYSSGIDHLYEAKMVVIGRGFAGKTSLVKRLTDPNFRLKKVLPSTEGIEIAEWDLAMRLEHSNHFRFNVWDFGGQEKYDATHQFFITERTLYLFVTEARQESNWLDFDYWLNVVQMLGNESPVIVVQNKIDQRRRQLPTERYKTEFPNIFAFADVSCADGEEETIKDLLGLIKEAVHTLPQLGDELPTEWVDIRKELETINRDHISYQDYLDICAKHHQDKEKADWLSRYFHDLGIIVHYANDPLLKQLVVINPDWAVDGVYNVLDTPIVEQNRGRFTLDDLEEIWHEPKYSDMRPQLLALMRNYQLCFEMGSSGTYIAPELLPANPIKYTPITPESCLTFTYQFGFMPAGLLTRFIVKIHRLIESDLFWRYGVIVAHEGNRALIEEYETRREIHIYVEGPTKGELLAIIRERFGDIFNEFHRRIDVQEMIPCVCNICNERIISGIKPHEFNWQTVKRYSDNKIEKIRCDESLKEVQISELMGDINSRLENIDELAGFGNSTPVQRESNQLPSDDRTKQIHNNKSYKLLSDTHLVGIFVGISLLSLLLIAILIPQPSSFQQLVFRVFLALAAAGVGAFIPGLFEVNVRKSIRATGAAAFFVVIYLINPPALLTTVESESSSKTAVQAHEKT